MDISPYSPEGEFRGFYVNGAPGSQVLREQLVGSVGKGVPATLGFVVNFEVSLEMVTYYCSGFAIYACCSFSRKRSASTSLFVFLCVLLSWFLCIHFTVYL